MARENQGLQIALIVFVILTIILGVTTFIFHSQYTEATAKAEKNQQTASTEMIKSRTVQEENNKLKGLMGFASTMKLEEIRGQFDEDMKTYASMFPEETQYYHPVLAQLAKARNDKSTELAKLKLDYADLQLDLEKREEIMVPQITTHDDARKESDAELVKRSAVFKAEGDRIRKERADTADLLSTLRKDSSDDAIEAQAKLDTTSSKLTQMAELLAVKSEMIEKITKPTFATPDGKITWVNQRDGTVWINLGRADSLARQVTFSVYPKDTTNLATDGKKAKIEVTQILDEHLAEARVLEDKVTDPIMPGDKIHTPVWSAGEKKRFALAGFIDIDNDGKSDLHTVRNLISMNGGIVDCYIDERTGEVQGAM
ncbi:hypothetical protein LCGC14_2713690, partial [marine sediment metagenome]